MHLKQRLSLCVSIWVREWEREKRMSPYFDLKEGSREVGQPKPKKLPRNLLSFSSRARRLGVVGVCVCVRVWVVYMCCQDCCSCGGTWKESFSMASAQLLKWPDMAITQPNWWREWERESTKEREHFLKKFLLKQIPDFPEKEINVRKLARKQAGRLSGYSENENILHLLNSSWFSQRKWIYWISRMF